MYNNTHPFPYENYSERQVHRLRCELPGRLGRLGGELPCRASFVGDGARAWVALTATTQLRSYRKHANFGC